MYLLEGVQAWFGTDKFFWILPTKPKLYVNYLEQLFTEDALLNVKSTKELKIKADDDYDPTGKIKE